MDILLQVSVLILCSSSETYFIAPSGELIGLTEGLVAHIVLLL